MNGLQGILVAQTPMWAMFADMEGRPITRRVQCLGVIQNGTTPDGGTAIRLVSGYVIAKGLPGYEGGPLAPADYCQGFIGYSEDPGTGPFDKLAREARKRIKDEQQREAQKKIIVPEDKVVQAITATHDTR